MTNHFSQRFQEAKVLFKDLTGKNADENLEAYLTFLNVLYTSSVDQGTDLLLKEIESLKKEVADLKTELNKQQAFSPNPLL
jgi:hypothetical protein